MNEKQYPTLPPMVSLVEMPEVLGVSRQWCYQMRVAGVMPEPDLMLGRTPGWIKARIVDWWATNPTKRGTR